MPYFVYIVKCFDGTLYTGSTSDVDKRVRAHNTSKTGAKYTRARRPVKLVYQETKRNRLGALRREAAIKKLSRLEKRSLFLQTNHQKLVAVTQSRKKQKIK